MAWRTDGLTGIFRNYRNSGGKGKLLRSVRSRT